MQLGASVKASYGVVKAYDGDHQKRKLEAAQVCAARPRCRPLSRPLQTWRPTPCPPLPPQAKPQAAKRARADENAHEKTSALIEELLERETRALGATQPPADCAQAGWVPAAASCCQLPGPCATAPAAAAHPAALPLAGAAA